MRQKLMSLMLVIAMVFTCSMTGCGKNNLPQLDVGSRLKTIEKHLNKLDSDYFIKNVYVETIETDSEALVAVAFLGNVIFETTGAVTQAVFTTLMNGIEKTGLLTKKELGNIVSEWKENILEDFEYEITGYEVIENAYTSHDNAVVVRVDHRITVNNIAHSDSILLEFVYQDKKWKFQVITEADIRYGDKSEEGAIETTNEAAIPESTDNNDTEATDASDIPDKEELSEVTTGTVDTPGIDLSYDLSGIHFLWAPDNTKSMMGYSADPLYVAMMKGMENILGTYKNSSIATLMGDDNRHLRWFPYSGKVALGVTSTDKSYTYYCSGGSYESVYAGPIHLLLEDENKVGAFSADTVTTLVTDLHEQGGTLYELGNDIRKACINSLGDEKEYGIAVFCFQFFFDGNSYIVNPNDMAHSISAKFDGTTDKRPVYVIMAGQKEGVYDYSTKLKSWMRQNSISFEYIDNLRAIEDPDVHLAWDEAPSANQKQIKDIIKSKSDNTESELDDYLKTHITRLEECPREKVNAYTSTDISDQTLFYVNASMEINTKYKGFWNWTHHYIPEMESVYNKVPYVTICDSVQVFAEDNSNWVELSPKDWMKLFEISTENGALRVTSLGKHSSEFYKKKNFRFVFHMKQTLNKIETYPSWINSQDMELSGILISSDEKEWHKKTRDLDLFCRSLLAMTTTEDSIDCGIEHTQDLEVVILNVSNK